jgi:hypothetical protein
MKAIATRIADGVQMGRNAADVRMDFGGIAFPGEQIFDGRAEYFDVVSALCEQFGVQPHLAFRAA